jgi:hypothetical protein
MAESQMGFAPTAEKEKLLKKRQSESKNEQMHLQVMSCLWCTGEANLDMLKILNKDQFERFNILLFTLFIAFIIQSDSVTLAPDQRAKAG